MQLKIPTILGILNLTPDSFSDGGEFFRPMAAIKQAMKMCVAGADLIDVGGESTRPGARPVSPQVELKRILPVLKKLKSKKIRVSLDSHQSKVILECLPYIDWLNDVTGLENPAIQKLAAQSKKPVILMHSTEIPVNPRKILKYKNVVLDLKKFFQKRIQVARKAGVLKEKIILDPGIGFGKSLTDNLKLLTSLKTFVQMGYPVCLGASRKSFIGQIDGSKAYERLGGSLAVAISGYQQGVQIYRVHDIAETVQALRIASKIKA